jgi:hypothetical protein
MPRSPLANRLSRSQNGPALTMRWISSRMLRLLRFDTTFNAHGVEVEAA